MAGVALLIDPGWRKLEDNCTELIGLVGGRYAEEC